MTHLTHKIGLLSRLSSQYKLRILNLWVLVKIDKHLQDVGAVISNTVNLESLDLTAYFDSDSICQKTFSGFYHGLSQLERLIKLSLNLTSKNIMMIKPAYTELAVCLGGLSQLEELSLDVLDVNLHLDFLSVLEGLNKIAHQLEKFSMNFMGSYFDEKDELGLIDVLEKMKGLRELGIERFSFKQSEKSLLKFKAVLEGYKDLKKIIWKGFESPKEGGDMFFEVMISVLEKKGVG